MNLDDKITAERRLAEKYISYDGIQHDRRSVSGVSQISSKYYAVLLIAAIFIVVGTTGLVLNVGTKPDNEIGATIGQATTTKLDSRNYVTTRKVSNDKPRSNNSTQSTRLGDLLQPSSSPAVAASAIVRSTSGQTAANSPPPPAAPPAAPSPANTPSPPTRVSKLLVFMVGNHSAAQMKSEMPYAFGLGKRYAYANNYMAIRHPALPNYVAIATGDTQGISNSKPPGENSFQGTSVFAQTIRSGKTAKVYAEGMPNNCALNDGGDQYRVDHNPWAYVRNERDLCNRYNVNLPQLHQDINSGRLPNAGMVIPNACHSGHSCSLRAADNWVENQIKNVMSGSDWKSGRLAIVITGAEDNGKGDNKVLAVIAHASQNGSAASCSLNHYSLSRLYSEVTRTSALLNARGAASMASCLGLPI